jgi:integrase
MAGKGSVYRRGRTWTAHLSWGKHQTKKGGFRTKAEAQTALTEMAAAVQDRRFVPAGKRTFGRYLDDWLDSLTTAGRRETTIASYRRLARTHIQPALGEIGLGDLAATDLDRLYADMTTQGLTLRTVRFAHSVIHKALADARQKGLVLINVATQASPPKTSATRAPEATVWTPEQLRAFLDQTSGHQLGALIRLAAMTGMRRGEICGLRWCDVDLDAATVTVQQTITTIEHRVVAGDVKSAASRRMIDLDAATVAALRRHRVTQTEYRLLAGPGWVDTGLVFTQPDGRALHPDSVGAMVGRLITASGLPRIRFHDLRHAHATHLLASGVDVKLVSARLGHASSSFTLDRYGHVMPGQGARAAAAVAALVDGVQPTMG